MSEENKDPEKDNPQNDNNKPDPSEKKEDKSQETHIETEDLPDKFKGKSPSEIAKSYIELEKKLGSYSQTQTELEQWRELGNIIKSDPALLAAVKAKAEPTPTKDDGEKSTSDREIRETVSDQIVRDFEKEYGIDKLDAEKRQEMHRKIGNELADMLDPGGSKSTREIVESINLKKLPAYLSKAYKLATIDDEKEQARARALFESRKNAEATFSSYSSSSVSPDRVTLSNDEKDAAKKLGITEEQYLKNKKELLK